MILVLATLPNHHAPVGINTMPYKRGTTMTSPRSSISQYLPRNCTKPSDPCCHAAPHSHYAKQMTPK